MLNPRRSADTVNLVPTVCFARERERELERESPGDKLGVQCVQRQRKRQKSNRGVVTLVIDKNNFAVQHAFWYISFPSLHDYDLKLPTLKFHGGRKRVATKFSISF